MLDVAANAAKDEAYSCDVSQPEPIADTITQVVADFGRIDILVNNAGVSHAKPFDTVTDEDWQSDLDLKLFAAIRLARLVLPGSRARRWGRIVNVLNIGTKTPAPTRLRPVAAPPPSRRRRHHLPAVPGRHGGVPRPARTGGYG